MDPLADAEKREWTARLVALPLALVAARVVVPVLPGPVRLITMWVHETGHAVTAWMGGFAAWPGPWLTPVGGHRSFVFSALLVSALGYGAYRAWQIERWFWIASASAAVATVLALTMLLSSDAAQQLIIFGGDGGMLVVGTALMLTVYARADHPVRRNQLRWGLVAIGALAFMDAYIVWTGPVSLLPFGENENGLSDPSVLVEQYGWTVPLLVARYKQLAHACTIVLLIACASGLLLRQERAPARRQK